MITKEDAAYLQKLENLHELILEEVSRLGNEWITITDKHNVPLAKVAYAPFANWCVSRMDRHTKTHLLPEWPYISPTGIKMVMDDPVHSDWLLSGGIDLLARWDEDDEFQLASHRKMAEIQKKLFGFECAVLSTGTEFTSGDVVLVTDKNQKVEEGSIVVLKNATEEFESQMRQATKNGTGGVIVENGSKVAHLALVGRESNIVMMRLENAFETLKDDDRVLLDSKNGKIEIIV